MSETTSPVQYIDEPESRDDYGYTTPGWYFWDETWATCYGPYEDEEAAKKKLQQYIEECL